MRLKCYLTPKLQGRPVIKNLSFATNIVMICSLLAPFAISGMERRANNLVVLVRYHHPTEGITPHYFSVPSTGTIGDLQNQIQEKLGKPCGVQALILNKKFLECSIYRQMILTEKYEVASPKRPLANDAEYGTPIIEKNKTNIIAEFSSPSFDLICTDEHQDNPSLKLKKLLEDRLYISITIPQQELQQADDNRLLKKHKPALNEENNEFGDF